jgi:hypothetical protein
MIFTLQIGMVMILLVQFQFYEPERVEPNKLGRTDSKNWFGTKFRTELTRAGSEIQLIKFFNIK